ncbi:MAG: hypothetical protein HN742_13465 [Lentisphaerae bacterium]|jgi:hypothetical protein|nr:hypothetical protein [Lentisphaerota bacterium]MBT5608223.1 hypothetical protein [Lentisphaerota bacterium]MBT7058888.1 hypothetical protein [Lentisphaerota bacterium]MBT7842881.1 hypothetical protein [Lentisphaerota bacterium]
MSVNRFLAAVAVATLLCSCTTPPRYRGSHPFLKEQPRILVDKVLMLDNKWVMTEDHVREIKAAGFNVVSPRLGGTDPARVRKVAAMAQKHDMFYVAWMRGSLSTPKNVPESERYVYADGHSCDIYSPNADALWDWMEKTILEHVRISVEIPAMAGSFLDFENYAKGKAGNCYNVSYDSSTLQAFAAARGLTLPELGAAQHAEWVAEQKLEDAFRDFQIAGWRERARRIREKIDAINPGFLLLIYPAPGTLLMTEGLYPEWATEEAPLVLCNASTYGRPSEFIEEAAALKANRKILKDTMKVPRAAGIPHVYLGGIDPVCAGADPEFCGKNASLICDVTDGYWIFYEGPEYKKDHPEYFRWFKQANADSVAGEFDLWRQPRSQPEQLGDTTLERKTDLLQVGIYNTRKKLGEDIESTGKYEIHKVRGMSLEYLQKLDVIVLQNFNLAIETDHPISINLRKYVEQGGGLLLGHDTAWFMESLFPKVAKRGYPKHKVDSVRHVLDTTLVVAAQHPGLPGLAPGARFETEFGDHMIFKPGPEGSVIVRNQFGDPVYVVADVGKGRVVYSGCYYGYSKNLKGGERATLLGLVDWLAENGE